MVENLRREKSEKEAQLAALENDMNSRKDDALAISAEKEKLEKELVAIQGKLADKQEKLQTADRQLSDLKENMDAIQERTEQLKEEAYEYTRDVHSKVDSLLKDAMLENMVDEWRELSARMKPSERQLFDGTSCAPWQNKARKSCTAPHCCSSAWSMMPLHLPKHVAEVVAAVTSNGDAMTTRTTGHGRSAA